MKAFPAWPAWLTPPKTASAAFLITLGFTALVVGIVAPANSTRPLIVMQLDTEVLVQRVARPELSSLPVVGGRFADAANCAGMLVAGRFTGVIRPPEGALLSYHWTPERLLIDVESPPSPAEIRLSNRAEEECRFSPARLQVEISPVPTTSDPAWQLPIAGPAVAGSEFGSPLAPKEGGERVYDLLRGGTISVYGKSIDRNMLFPIGNGEFEVPAGSRVASGPSLPLGSGDAGPSWYGVALYDPDRGLRVSATTEAGELLLFRPSPSAQQETFGIGLLATVFGDPATGMIAFTIGTFLAIAGIVTSFMGLWRDRRDSTGS